MHASEHDVLLIHDGIKGNDAELLQAADAQMLTYSPLHLRRELLPEKTPVHYLFIFEAFRLLEQYRTVVWLDCDLAVQGDLSPLRQYGPLAMAVTDSSFLRDGISYSFGRNFYNPEPFREAGYDIDSPFANSGVVVFQDTLPRPLKLYEWCISTFEEHCANLRHSDQAVLNMLALKFPDLFSPFPAGEFNCYPLNPASAAAKIVHCFGAHKFWNDGLLALAFPEWQRDYQAWQRLGGSTYAGTLANAGLAGQSAYQFLTTLVDRLNKALEQK
jgi:lipopolysaccharide biosynthesis glycosyltransferase